MINKQKGGTSLDNTFHFVFTIRYFKGIGLSAMARTHTTNLKTFNEQVNRLFI